MTYPTHTLHLRLPLALVQTIRQAAGERGLTTSEMVSQLLADTMQTWTPTLAVWGRTNPEPTSHSKPETMC